MPRWSPFHYLIATANPGFLSAAIGRAHSEPSSVVPAASVAAPAPARHFGVLVACNAAERKSFPIA